MSQCLQKKLSMTLKLDGVPRYFIKKVPQYWYSVPSTDGTGTGAKKSTALLLYTVLPTYGLKAVTNITVKNKIFLILTLSW